MCTQSETKHEAPRRATSQKEDIKRGGGLKEKTHMWCCCRGNNQKRLRSAMCCSARELSLFGGVLVVVAAAVVVQKSPVFFVASCFVVFFAAVARSRARAAALVTSFFVCLVSPNQNESPVDVGQRRRREARLAARLVLALGAVQVEVVVGARELGVLGDRRRRRRGERAEVRRRLVDAWRDEHVLNGEQLGRRRAQEARGPRRCCLVQRAAD